MDLSCKNAFSYVITKNLNYHNKISNIFTVHIFGIRCRYYPWMPCLRYLRRHYRNPEKLFYETCYKKFPLLWRLLFPSSLKGSRIEFLSMRHKWPHFDFLNISHPHVPAGLRGVNLTRRGGGPWYVALPKKNYNNNK